jgi:hypothetical protein
MTKKDEQQSSLSLRISAGLREQLENLADSLSLRLGVKLPISEAAKMALKNATAEQVDLMADPLTSMLLIRGKLGAGEWLSQAEWSFLIGLVERGAQTWGRHAPISDRTRLEIAKAFVALLKVKRGNRGYRPELIVHLEGDVDERIPDAEVIAATEAMIRQPENAAAQRGLFQITRSLYSLIHGERFQSAEAINTALLPHHRVLWGVAARGYYFSNKSPVRKKREWGDPSQQKSLPDTTVRGVGISAMQTDDGDLSFIVSLPGPFGALVTFGSYPKIAEFRAMQATLRAGEEGEPTTAPGLCWNGEHYFGYFATRGESRGFWYRGMGAVTLGFREEDWAALKEAFDAVCAKPEVDAVLKNLWWEYGDL